VGFSVVVFGVALSLAFKKSSMADGRTRHALPTLTALSLPEPIRSRTPFALSLNTFPTSGVVKSGSNGGLYGDI